MADTIYMKKVVYTTLEDIKKAVDAGIVVHYASNLYNVVKSWMQGSNDRYIIYCPSTYFSGGFIENTFNSDMYKEGDFYSWQEVTDSEEAKEFAQVEEETFTEDSTELKEWSGDYSAEALDGYEIIMWPEVQTLFEKEGFRDNSFLINDEDGMSMFGSSAYVVSMDFLRKNN